jgi:hypothetical protein
MKRVFSFYSPRLFTIIFSIVFIIVLLSLTGCSQPKETTPAKTTITPSNISKIETGTGYSIAVFSNDKQLGSLTLDQLSKLKKVTFTIEGKDEEGPTVLSALKLLSINDFTEITFYGYSKGRLATAELKLTKTQVNDKVILDFSNQGTAKLASPDIPSNNWVIDVTKIAVK